MKTIIACSLILFAALTVQAGPGDVLEVNASKVRVSFDEEGSELVMVFAEDFAGSGHSVIDLNRLTELEYKTRVMRYFGGLLKNETHHFKKLRLVQGGETIELPFSRENISRIVNNMCDYHLGEQQDAIDMIN
jgi:hypothetical protein